MEYFIIGAIYHIILWMRTLGLMEHHRLLLVGEDLHLLSLLLFHLLHLLLVRLIQDYYLGQFLLMLTLSWNGFE